MMAAPSHMALMIIAIDGPAASGKGTLGKRLAHHYGYRHLDTGVIYRAVAKALMDAGADLTNETLAVSAALELDPEKFGNPALKTQIVGDAASVVSARDAEIALIARAKRPSEPPPRAGARTVTPSSPIVFSVSGCDGASLPPTRAAAYFT